nr:BhlA/UviB family holin-like peptide [Sporomusa sphaeroides]
MASPNSAWALLAIVLVIYVMRDGGKREERLTGIIDGTLTEQTKTLNHINTSLISMKDALCDVKGRVEDIEDLIGIEKEERKNG